MQRNAWAIIAVVLVGAVAVGYWVKIQQAEPPPVAQESPPTPPAPVAPAAPAPSTPAIAHPLETLPAVEPLPELDQSDRPFLKVLIQVLGEPWKVLINSEELIHKIVVTADNLPRRNLPAKVVPLNRAKGAFLTSGKGEELAIGAYNPERYIAYVRLIESVDSRKLVTVYRQFYPLFQRAYNEIGYPQAYFNDRLVEAIDDLLAAPEPDEPIRLVQPKVLYQFADASLEARSAGQKIMIRIGRDNAGRLKTKLREIRRQVVQADQPT